MPCRARRRPLSTDLTVDNSFLLFISTDDSLAGTPVGSGSDWTTTYSFSAALTPGVTNDIHVAATNGGAPAAFIGDFALGDANSGFANGAQFLLTDTSHWQVSPTAFGAGDVTPVSFGPNGTSPWGSRPSIDASAQFIWDSASPCPSCTVYFSTPLAPVPEPETCALMMAGFALLGFVARRKRKLDLK